MSVELNSLGNVSRQFESGEQGAAAIGYDVMGGTSYGMYQFSSRYGTIASFIHYLQKKAPDIAHKLQHAGKSNTGSTRGVMPAVWQEIARTEPKRFAQLQHDFAVEYYYLPIAKGFQNTIPRHKAINELLFSTAIHHGVQGATSIIKQAYKRYQNDTKQFIREVYALRKQHFMTSTASVKMAVHSRLMKEMNTILDLYAS